MTAMLSTPGWAVSSSGRPLLHRQTREVVDRFVDLLYGRRLVRAAFESCVASRGFVDHAPARFRSRSEAMRQLAPKLGPRGLLVDVQHTAIDGDLGMVHLRVRRPEDGGEPQSRVEIFRVADGRIVEHWGVCSTPEEHAS